MELLNCRVQASQTLPSGFRLWFCCGFCCLFSVLKQVPSLPGYLEHRHKALPTVVFLPGLARLHAADRRLHHGGSQGAEQRRARGERANELGMSALQQVSAR